MKFSVQGPNLNNSKNASVQGMKRVLWKAMTKMEEIAKLKAPVDTGNLKNRIHLSPMQYGAELYTLSDGVSYGFDLEFGNRPHKVSWEPIEEWVKRKGIRTTEAGIFLMTRYVVEKIRTQGVNAQPFFRPALHEVEQVWLPIYKKQVFG